MTRRGRPRNFDRTTALTRAMEIFWEQGYEGTSISDLTAVMGINTPSLYAAFGSKEALFREAVALYNENSPTDRAIQSAPTTRAVIEAMLRDNVAAYVDPATPPGCMIVLAAVRGAPENAIIREYLADYRRRDHAALQQRLEQGIADGDLPEGTDTNVLAAFYLTVLEGLSIQARDGTVREVLDAVVDHALSVWDMLCKSSATAPQNSTSE